MSDVASLLARVADPELSHYKRRDAFRELLRADPDAARPVCLRLLEDPEKLLRREAAKSLADAAENGDHGVFDALAGAALDEDEDVRRAVIRGLAHSTDRVHRPALVALSEDRSYFIRRGAEEALQAFDRAVTPLPREPREKPRPERETTVASTAGSGGGIGTRPPPWAAKGGDGASEGTVLEASASGTVLTRSQPLTPSQPLAPSPRPTRRARGAPRPEPEAEPTPEPAIELGPLVRTKTEPIRLEPLPDVTPTRRPRRRKRKKRRSKRSSVRPPVSTPSPAAQRILDTVRKRTGVRTERDRREGAKPAQRILRTVREKGSSKRPARGQTERRHRETREQLQRQKRGASGAGTAARCGRCGWALRAGQKFCVFCGAPSGGGGRARSTVPKATVPRPTRRAAPRARPIARRGRPAAAKSGMIGCLVVFAILGGVIYFAYSGVAASWGEIEASYAKKHRTKRSRTRRGRASVKVPMGQYARVTLKDSSTVRGTVIGRTSRHLTLYTSRGNRRIRRSRIAREERINRPAQERGLGLGIPVR